jgi:hypothetical protein
MRDDPARIRRLRRPFVRSNDRGVVLMRYEKITSSGAKTANITGLPARPDRRLSPEQVRDIRTSGETLKVLGERHGLTPVAVFHCKHRLTYKDLP